MALKRTRTQCTTCHARCGVIVYSDEDNQIVKIEGDPDNVKSHGVICGSGMSEREIHNNTEGRLLYPMKRVDCTNGERHPENRGKSEFERITWDEAMDIIACRNACASRRSTAPRPSSPARAPAASSNHWHCRLNSSLGLEGWSLVPTHVCLMPHILPNAFTLGHLQPAKPATPRNANCIVALGRRTPPCRRRGAKEAVREPGAPARPSSSSSTRATRTCPSMPTWPSSRAPAPTRALALGHHPRGHRAQVGTTRTSIDNWTYGFDELAERVKDWTPERAAEVCWIDARRRSATAARIMGRTGPSP